MKDKEGQEVQVSRRFDLPGFGVGFDNNNNRVILYQFRSIIQVTTKKEEKSPVEESC